MFVCLDCHSLFTDPEHRVCCHGLETYPYENTDVCPFCGGPYVAADKCDCCNEYIQDKFCEVLGYKICESCFALKELGD